MNATDEIIEAEVIGREVAPFQPTVALAVSVDEALAQWQDYQRLTRELLDDTDYQAIGQKRFKKKSAWRKYARAFNITDRVTFEDIQRDETGFPMWARIRVEARANNGRTAEADHECHVSERCCERPCRKSSWQSHECCPDDCSGKRHWSHPGDLPATALTRAKNRAISDLIGAGEVSAEEMTEQHVERSDRPAFRPPPRGGEERPAHNGAPTRPPVCRVHGAMAFRKAGTAMASGKSYEAFWGCQERTCKVTVSAVAWDDQLRNEAQPKSEEVIDHGDLPFEE